MFEDYEDNDSGDAGDGGEGGSDAGGTGDGGDGAGNRDPGSVGGDSVVAAAASVPLTNAEILSTIEKAKEAGVDTTEWDAKAIGDYHRSTQKYKVKVDGDELEVGIEDLLRGYQRQSDYTRKTQSLAAERKQFEAQQASFTNSEAYKTMRALAEKDNGEFDPYNPDSFMAHMKQEVAKQFLATLEPIEKEHAANQQAAAYEAFVEAHPEITDPAFETEMVEILSKNPQLTTQLAYDVVKGRHATKAAAGIEAETKARREAMKKAGLTIGAGSGEAPGNRDPRIAPAHIRQAGPAALYKWMKDNGLTD